METMETMETSVVPQGHSVWGTGTLPGGQVISSHPTSLRPYEHDYLLPKNLPLRGLRVSPKLLSPLPPAAASRKNLPVQSGVDVEW